MNAFVFNPQRLLSDAPVIRHESGACYGREISIVARDDLDDRVDDHVFELALNRRKQLPRVLDLGGATGYRASQLTAEAFVVDICDQSEVIASRNKWRTSKAAIGFAQADVRDLSNIKLPHTNWDLLHMRRTAHWMPLTDVENLISFLPTIASKDAHLAMCFIYSPRSERGTVRYPKTQYNNFFQHHPKDMLDMLRDNGYSILDHGNDEHRNGRTYKVFAQLPGSRKAVPHHAPVFG